MSAVVRASGLVKRWGDTTALAGVSVEVGTGVTGLLGANGAGKTTLLGLVLGLHRPDEGSIEVLGLDPATAGPQVRERLGYVPEHEALTPDVRAFDLVRHLAEVHGLPSREATGRASDALWLVGLGEERQRPVGTMSTGQRQRVKLAAALAHDPALLLLDEPTNGLDPVQRDEMLGLVRRVSAELGIDVVLSSHLLEEVERTCDATVILAEGRVVASGSLAALRAGGTGLVVEVDGRAELLATHLRRTGLGVEVDGLRLVVEGPPEAGADAVRDVAAAHRVGLRRVQARTATLEDVFLAAERSCVAESHLPGLTDARTEER
ncbi:MAG: ABC transporter ATP-binding protein [Actinomycetota bacterium]|nr:ABC transporter ATP-binding protein [Actinomycetota bacterium]